MTVKATMNPRGYLRFRVYRDGREYVIGTKWKDDGPGGRRRKLVEARAALIEDYLERGVELHRALIAVLGQCPPRFMPHGGVSLNMTVGGFVDEWLPMLTKRRMRKSYIDKSKWYADAVILPYWKNVRLADVDAAALEDFQIFVLSRTKANGETIATKTAKNIVVGHFGAIIRDARKRYRLPERDPMEFLSWQTEQMEDPDPFTREERDQIIAFFRDRRPRWYPWVAFCFWTGLRPSEAAALRIGDYDRKARTVRITKSRTEGEENAPKTVRSTRTIALYPEAVAALEALTARPWDEPEAFLFVGATNEPILSKEWPKKSFYPVLVKLNVRRRKFYATRHTFISELISAGESLKAIAEYCGTSTTMIERSYGRWIATGTDGSIKSLRALETGRFAGRSVVEVEATGTNGAEFNRNLKMVPRGIEGGCADSDDSSDGGEDPDLPRESSLGGASSTDRQTPQNRRTNSEDTGRRPVSVYPPTRRKDR